MNPDDIIKAIQEIRERQPFYYTVLLTEQKFEAFVLTVRFSSEEQLTEKDAATVARKVLTNHIFKPTHVFETRAPF